MEIITTQLLGTLLTIGSNPNITISNELPIDGILLNNYGYEIGDIFELEVSFPIYSMQSKVCYVSFRATAEFTPIISGNVSKCEFTTEIGKYYTILGYFNGTIWLIDVQEYEINE